MSAVTGNGYRTFVITGTRQLTTGSVPNLNSLFYGGNKNLSLQEQNTDNNEFNQTPDDLRRAMRKYLSASASDLRRIADSSFKLHRTLSAGMLNSRGSSRANSPAPSQQHLEVSIRVSTPDISDGKMPPNGRGRPHSPNISMIKGPKLSVYYFNDDFTFDEDSSQAELAVNMLNNTTSHTESDTSKLTDNDNTDSTLLSDANTIQFDESSHNDENNAVNEVDDNKSEDTDKTPVNTSASDGGYVSSDMSDHTLHGSNKSEEMGNSEKSAGTATETDKNNNDICENIVTKSESVTTENMPSKKEVFGMNVCLMNDVNESNVTMEVEAENALNKKGEQEIMLQSNRENTQRPMSLASDEGEVFSSDDNTFRMSEMKTHTMTTLGASELKTDDSLMGININDTDLGTTDTSIKSISNDTNSNITYDIRINDSMGIPMVSTLKRQEDQQKLSTIENEINQSELSLKETDSTIGDHNKSVIQQNQSMPQERSMSFSGLTHLEKLRSRHGTGSYRDLSHIQNDHSYVRRNASFVRSIENSSPWKGVWNERNVHFDETAHQKYKRDRQAERNTQYWTRKTSPKQNLHRPQPQRHSFSVHSGSVNPNLQAYKLHSSTQTSNLARHLHNTSAPGVVSDTKWNRYSSPPTSSPSIEPKSSYSIENTSAYSPNRSQLSDATQLHQHNYPQEAPRSPSYDTSKDKVKTVYNPNKGKFARYQMYRNSIQFGSKLYSNSLFQERRNPLPTNLSPETLSVLRPKDLKPGQYSGRIRPSSIDENLLNQSQRLSYTTQYVPIPESSDSNGYPHANFNQSRSVRRKLQLSDPGPSSEGDIADSDPHPQTRHSLGPERQQQVANEMRTSDTVPRHPAVRSLQEPHRWVGR